MLRLVDEFGLTAQHFFERVYRGLGRKSRAPVVPPPIALPPEPDQMTALRQANRELAARVKEAQGTAARLEAVFGRIEEGVVMQSPEGRVVLVNPAALRLLGSMRSFWDSELGRLFKKAGERTAAVENGELEQVGEPIQVQVNDRILGAQLAAVHTAEGVLLGTLIILRDVTREALADRLKDQFVTQISHELRTPLTTIKGMSEVLLAQPADKPPSRKFLEAIGRNVATLDRMIVELLDISEISAGTFAIRREEVLLDELALDVLRGREAQIKRGGLTAGVMVADRSRLRVQGDMKRLAWALGHLLDNSVNYTLKGGLLTLRLGVVRGNAVLIEVMDNGVGIAERDMQRVFERFYRGEARTPEGKLIDPRGLGQGLYIARAVAEAHGGYLVGSSAVGQGSKFTLGLPLREEKK